MTDADELVDDEIYEYDEQPAPSRGLGILLTITGLIGLIAAAALLIEKIEVLKDPNYVPSCSFNPVLSCGSVMNTEQASAFGFPNPIIGVAGFAAITLLGLAVLAGAVFRPWFWAMVQGAVTLAVVFIHWLIFQSLYEISALCPYCMVVWVVTIVLFWRVTLHNLQPVLENGSDGAARVVGALVKFRALILVVWFLVIIALIAQRFWDFWVTLF